MLDLNLNLNLGLASVFGDPTALTQNNADALFTALGLTQAGTGTTWGETGQDATPLYPVAAAKVPLAVEEINGKNYFGPIVNPAGTNLALHDRNATHSAWVKTNCTAALALGGLEHGLEWRGEELISPAPAGDASLWGGVGSGASYNGGVLELSGVTTGTVVANANLATIGKFYYFSITLADWISGNVSVRIGSADIINVSGPGTFTGIGFADTEVVRITGRIGPTTGSITAFSMQEVDAHTIITSSSDNATAVTSITSTSGERVSKFWVQTDDEDVFVSHGAPTGSALYEDDFSSDTSGDWTRGFQSVDGTLAVSSGALVYTRGAGDGGTPRFTLPITSLVVGKIYKISFSIGGTAPINNRRLGIGVVSNGNPYLVEFGQNAPNGANVRYFQASASTMYLVLGAAGSTGDTVTLDDVSIYEVAETELTPGLNPVPVDLTPSTFANPQLGIRLANNGDSVRLYGVQHQVAARPLRPYIGPTAGSTVTAGARTLNKTLGVAPTEIDIEIIFKTPPVLGTLVLFQASITSADDFTLYINGGNLIARRVISSSTSQQTLVAASVDTVYKVDMQWSGTTPRARVNDGSWVNLTSGTIPAFTKFGLNDTNFTNPGASPILAFRDNIGTLFQQIQDYGIELVTNGGFDTDITGWSDASSAGGSISWNALGYLDLVHTSGTPRARQTISTEAGAVYFVDASVLSSDILLNVGTTPGANDIIQQNLNTPTFFFTAVSTTTHLQFAHVASGTTKSIDSISVRKVNYRPNLGWNHRVLDNWT